MKERQFQFSDAETSISVFWLHSHGSLIPMKFYLKVNRSVWKRHDRNIVELHDPTHRLLSEVISRFFIYDAASVWNNCPWQIGEHSSDFILIVNVLSGMFQWSGVLFSYHYCPCWLIFFRLGNSCSSAGPYWSRGRGRGCVECARNPPRAVEVHFFSVDQRFSRLELITLLKDHDDQYLWSQWFVAANPAKNTDFQLYFYFCSF